MKRFWIMLLAVSVALVIALPAGAFKPPKPTPVAPMAISLDGGPMWVHEAGDVVWYSVTVQNKSRATVSVEVFYDGDEGPGSLPIEVEAKTAHVEEGLFSQTVKQTHIDDCLLDDQKCDLIAEVTVTYPDEGTLIAVAETATLIDPVDECIFEVDGESVVTKSGLCIWKPELTATGLWTISMEPDPAPTKPTRMMMTMRDGVPGNWCALENGDGGIVQERWLPTSPSSIVLNVYLPEDGRCVLGGHGVCTEDDCYFAVGNPESFYLYTTFDGFITLTNH